MSHVRTPMPTSASYITTRPQRKSTTTVRLRGGTREKLRGIYQLLQYRPKFVIAIVSIGFVATSFELVGVGFIIPIIEIVQNGPESVEGTGGITGMFYRIYTTLGIPLTLTNVIIGVSLVLTIRYTSSFVLAWMRIILRVDIIRVLRTREFDAVLDSDVSFFQSHGSDEIINAVVT